MRRVCTLALALLSLPAVAQEEETPIEARPRRELIIPKVQSIDFEKELEVDGELLKPGISIVTGLGSPEHPSLIELRQDFNPEMARSVSQIQ